MNPYAWALFAAVAAVTTEGLCARLSGEPYLRYLWLWIPLYIGINYPIYRIIGGAESLLDALVVFSMSTMALRVVVTFFILRQRVAPGTWVAVGLVVAANLVRRSWR